MNSTPDPEFALSVQQPWAWLIVNGYKDIENRTWFATRRGEILIHAGKKIDRAAIQAIRKNYPGIPLPEKFETGGIVGKVMLVTCVQRHTSPWFTGPYGFVLAKAKPLPFWACKGKLGFFRPLFETGGKV